MKADSKILDKLLNLLEKAKDDVNALYKAYYAAKYNDWETCRAKLYELRFDMDLLTMELYENIKWLAKEAGKEQGNG